MNAPSLFLRANVRCSNNVSRLHPRVTFVSFLHSKRNYATRREIPSEDPSNLSQSLDTKQRRSIPGNDNVGPFQLGLSSSARQGENVKKWSQLSAGGKVVRTTARTTNLAVILLGAGLSALLIYSLTSELFSKNSPTVLYNDACDRIQASQKIAKYLNSPLTFHNNPPSAIRPRHRNRHITSQVMVDSNGHEHMIMTFYVQGKPEGYEHDASDVGYLESLSEWSQEKYNTLRETSPNDMINWSKEKSMELWERGKLAFKYLSGAPVPPAEIPAVSVEETKDVKKEESRAWSFAGMFSSLKGGRPGTPEKVSRSNGKTFTEGEVHADLVRNNDGYFVFRYLLVDIPSSRERNPIRVFVERSPGVRENEPVMRWNAY